MEQFLKDPKTLLRLREGPLGTYIGSFAKQLTIVGKCEELLLERREKMYVPPRARSVTIAAAHCAVLSNRVVGQQVLPTMFGRRFILDDH